MLLNFITLPRIFFSKRGKKLSTFIGDSTYTRAPPTYRSPLQSNYRETRKLTTCDSVFPLSLFNMSDRSDIVCSLLPLSISFIIIFFCLFLNKRRFNIRKKKRCWFFHIMLTFAIKSRISDSVFSWFSNNEILEKKWIRIAFLKKLTEGFL
jgi:hypothetical protein